MLKKMLTFMGTGVLLLSLTACGSSYDAFELLERSNEVMEDVESMMTDLSMDVSVDAGMMAMTFPIRGHVAIDAANPADVSLSMEMSITMFDMEIMMEMHFRDGYLYIDEDGHRDVTPMPMSAARGEVSSALIDTNLNEAWVEESSIEEIDDGYRLEFIISEDSVGTLFNRLDFVNEFSRAIGDNIEVETATMIVYLDEEYYQTSVELEMTMGMRVEGQDSSMTIEMTMDIIATENVAIQFPAWLDEMHGAPIAGHELLGTWENGDGRIFLFGIGDPDAVEFRADGTLVITGGLSAGTSSWAPGTAGSFTVGNTTLRYRISGDQLTITNSANDDWTFDRAGTGSTSSANDEETQPVEDSSDEESALVGEWDWLGTLWWTFNADGTGYQEGIGNITWRSNGDVLTVTAMGVSLRYEYTITGNTLHLYGVDFPWDFEYRRR